MLRRLFPHPLLSLLLVILWLFLVGRPALGSLVMALILATAVPLLTADLARGGVASGGHHNHDPGHPNRRHFGRWQGAAGPCPARPQP